MRLIILIILIILIVGAIPSWPYSTGWGYYPVGGLGTIPPGTYADSYANDDLSGFFQFSQSKARAFQTIKAPLSADYFINDKRLPTAPDED